MELVIREMKKWIENLKKDIKRLKDRIIVCKNRLKYNQRLGKKYIYNIKSEIRDYEKFRKQNGIIIKQLHIAIIILSQQVYK